MLNVLIIGVGQCGNRILDAVNREAFGGSRLSKYYGQQKFPTQVDTIAINTAINDLKELKFTKAKDRIHIPYLHGVGANRNIGKKCFEENRDLLIQALEERGSYDVIFIITSTSGGTGSSFTPPMVEAIKEHSDVPIYGVLVLPFREEGTIYLQNSVFCLKEMTESKAEGSILIDNQFLKNLGKDIQTAYDNINRTIAHHLLFLLRALDTEMLMVTDLGDFKTVMTSGMKLATIGFAQGDKNTTVKTAIRQSISHSGLLFPLDTYNEANRAMLIIKGDKKHLKINDITSETDKLSSEIGHVFKGILIDKGEYPQVLSILSIGASKELEKLYNTGINAIKKEQEKKERTAKQKKTISEILKDVQPEY